MATSNANLKVGIVKESHEVWLINEAESVLELTAGELFGFNVGSFSERALGGRLRWLI